MVKILLVFIPFIFGGYFILDFFLPEEAKNSLGMTQFTPLALDLITIVSAMAFGLGLLNLFSIHVRRITLNLRGKIFSLTLLAGLCLTLASGLIQFFRTEFLNLQIAYVEKFLNLPEPERNEFSSSFKRLHNNFQQHCKMLTRECGESYITDLKSKLDAAQGSTANKMFDFLTNGIFFPLGAAMFSLLAFFIASASFRAFRFRDLLSALMLVTAAVVIVGQNSFFTSVFPELVDLRAWLLNVLSASVFRGIALGVLIAGLVFAIRIWLGIERVDQ